VASTVPRIDEVYNICNCAQHHNSIEAAVWCLLAAVTGSRTAYVQSPIMHQADLSPTQGPAGPAGPLNNYDPAAPLLQESTQLLDVLGCPGQAGCATYIADKHSPPLARLALTCMHPLPHGTAHRHRSLTQTQGNRRATPLFRKGGIQMSSRTNSVEAKQVAQRTLQATQHTPFDVRLSGRLAGAF
jgi:hypothetical protein